MAADRKLSRDFWLHEFPGWEKADEDDAAAAAETVARVLQPIRSALDVPVRVTSWMWWSSGEGRTGAHSQPGTVDFTADEGRTFEAFDWASRNLASGGYIGRLIYEPERSEAEGVPQGEHVHMAPRDAMVAVFNDPAIQVLREDSEGSYSFYRVAVATGAGALALAAAVIFVLARQPRPSTG